MDQSGGMEQLVNAIEQSLGRAVQTPVREAFLRMPRHLFVEHYYQQRGNSLTWDLLPATMEQVYADQPLVTFLDQRGMPTSSSSQPSVMAVQLEALDVAKGHHLLEIGAGTGYNAALMGELVGPRGDVISVDIDADLVQRAREHIASVGSTNIQIVQGDGSIGYTTHAPYDRLLATCSVRSLPHAWVDQLKPHGLLVCNLITSLTSLFPCVEKQEQGDLEGRLLEIDALYMPLLYQGRQPAKRLLTWHTYDELPHTPIHPAEPFDLLLKNPAYSLLLETCLPGVTRRYRSQGDEVQLWLFAHESAVQIKPDALVLYGNVAWLEQQITQSIAIYNKFGRPRIADYHVRIQERQIMVQIADQCVHIAL